jgi:hypothetical protein
MSSRSLNTIQANRSCGAAEQEQERFCRSVGGRIVSLLVDNIYRAAMGAAGVDLDTNWVGTWQPGRGG